MCETMTPAKIVALVAQKFLPVLPKIVNKNQKLFLPSSLLEGKFPVTWISEQPEVLSCDGTVGKIDTPQGVTLHADVTLEQYSVRKSYQISVLPAAFPCRS